MSFKVAFIGAGSVGFTRRLARDILTVPEFADVEFSLHDINAHNLSMVEQLVKRDIAENGLGAKVAASTDRKASLEGARYVINVSRIGGLEAFRQDVDIPLKYGVDQCVGDTICAGGIMYGQRNIPAVLDFCADVKAVAEPDALFLNYANPNAMNVWAAAAYGGVRTVGLCHGVMGGHHQICSVIELLVNDGRSPDSPGYVKVGKKDVDIVCAGINHQTWYVRVRYAGADWTGRLLEGFRRHPEYSKTEKVRIDVLERFGYYSTESNGHLSEYLAWYRKRPEAIAAWIDLSCWINGETGGYLRVCSEGRNWFETDFPQWLAEPVPKLDAAIRSEEHGSWIIEGLETGRVYRGHFNVVNDGAIANLPADCIVEVPGYVDRNGISIPRVGALPLGCAAVCAASVQVQRLAVEAAVRGDVALLKQALLMDPLTGAVCTTPEVSRMADEMLVAQAAWLPQYAASLSAARARLAAGPELARFDTTGAARIAERGVAELARDAAATRRSAAAADKGKMTKG
jgi:alpha-galactosidase